MKWKFLSVALLIFIIIIPHVSQAQHSVARQWNEALLDAIREDFARPTVHARNLFHTSIAMYDAWTAYDDTADTYLLGKKVDGFTCIFNGVSVPADVHAAREEAVSYAAYRLLMFRFQNSPGATTSLPRFDTLMTDLGYDASFTSTDYSTGSPAALGNYVAQCLIDFGLQDGANEQNGYVNIEYEPANPPLIPILPGNPDLVDPNRWQPLTLEVFIDQGGNIIPISTPEALSPEWGAVSVFSLTENDLTIYERDGFEYLVYHDPGDPPYFDTLNAGGLIEEYMWGFELVSIWSSHLDPTDSVMWDISPASIGNIQEFPQTIEGYRDFYNLLDGGDASTGHAVNPHTGQPYEPQMVPRGDYTRILAEFWADGPDSETPPGHWFTLLNYVNDHPDFVKRFRGEGPVLEELEWDVKAYLVMAGAMHDVAVSAWGIKGWYDYIRPVSAIRFMADLGQSSDTTLSNYSPGGIPLTEGLIEVVEEGDTLAGDSLENVGKIKLYAWRGPDFIQDPDNDVAGVDWILAENWWPYQRPTFITPPFPGYISGHSTFSRAAAEVMTLLTGDPFFPAGLGEFQAPKNEFLVFEDGPSIDVTLQWATYRDASDQCSLSRIWGGIHPPADDIPGRLIGEKIGVDAFLYAENYFAGWTPSSFSLVAPGDSATIDDLTVTFTWHPSIDQSNDGKLRYTFHLSGANTNITLGGLADTSFTFQGDNFFKPNALYSWFVEATDGIYTVLSTNQLQFRTPPDAFFFPSSFSLIAPGDNDMLDSLSVSFSWQQSIDPNDDDVAYNLHLLGPDMDTTIAGLSDTTLTFQGDNFFKPDTLYSWFVEATDGVYKTQSSSQHQFRTPFFVGIDAGGSIPEYFALAQNFPNPFNPATTIEYSLPFDTKVSITIYDILGREVIHLIDETKPAGYHRVVWNGEDRHGKDVASGVYIYRMTAGNAEKQEKFSTTKKLLRLK